MWKCHLCDAVVEDDTWEVCWQCSAPRTADARVAEQERKVLEEQKSRFMRCLRCEGAMVHGGRREFHEGTRLGALGDLAELLVSKEALDLWYCGTCGKVEFYMPDIGTALRPEPMTEGGEIR